MAWIILVLAGIFEVAWALALKYSEGFTKLIPGVITVVAMAISVYLLGVALKSLPIGTAYAIWTGIGTIGTVILGIFIFKEPATFMRLACISLIVIGILGLKFLPME